MHGKLSWICIRPWSDQALDQDPFKILKWTCCSAVALEAIFEDSFWVETRSGDVLAVHELPEVYDDKAQKIHLDGVKFCLLVKVQLPASGLILKVVLSGSKKLQKTSAVCLDRYIDLASIFEQDVHDIWEQARLEANDSQQRTKEELLHSFPYRTALMVADR